MIALPIIWFIILSLYNHAACETFMTTSPTYTELYAIKMVESLVEAHGNQLKLTNLYKIVVGAVKLTNEIREMRAQDKKQLILDVVYLIIEKDHGPLDRFDDIIHPFASGIIDEYLMIDTENDGLILAPGSCFGYFG